MCFIAAQNCDVPAPSDNSKCQVCSSGYQLDSSNFLCYPKKEGCLTYSSQDICSQCNTTNNLYYLRNGTCYYNDPNCIEYKIDGTCRRCSGGFTPLYSRCVFYDPFCSSYNSNGGCASGFAGFIATNFSQYSDYQSFIIYVNSLSSSSAASSSLNVNSSTG